MKGIRKNNENHSPQICFIYLDIENFLCMRNIMNWRMELDVCEVNDVIGSLPKIAPKKRGSRPHRGAMQDLRSWFVILVISISGSEFLKRRLHVLV